MITTVDLIRHGEPVGGRKYRGQLDDPLSEKGWQQMRDAVGEHCPWDSIISSPLLRCVEFANELRDRHKLAVKLEPQFMEIGFGSWEGKTAAQIQEQLPGALEAFWQDPINRRPQGAEPLIEFNKRIESAWKKLLQSHKGQHLLVVCHAGVIRMSLQYILGMPVENVFRIKVSNAGLTRIEIDHDGERIYPRLIFHDGRL
ncbi:MAG: histidine phosphatase family protein [Thioalkalispiraceae bacterium]|jgi:alpha-ribazole phosphatase/probable phosphoglycerate mutase